MTNGYEMRNKSKECKEINKQAINKENKQKLNKSSRTSKKKLEKRKLPKMEKVTLYRVHVQLCRLLLRARGKPSETNLQLSFVVVQTLCRAIDKERDNARACDGFSR
jgi:hypothetical protein